MSTIVHAVSNYATAMTLEGKNPEYADWLRRRLGDLAQFFQTSRGQARINSLSIEDGHAFVKYLMERKQRYIGHKLRYQVEGGLSPTTIHGYVRRLCSYSSWLCEDDHTDTNIFLGSNPPKLPQTIINPLSEDEIRKRLLAVQRDAEKSFDRP